MNWLFSKKSGNPSLKPVLGVLEIEPTSASIHPSYLAEVSGKAIIKWCVERIERAYPSLMLCILVYSERDFEIVHSMFGYSNIKIHRTRYGTAFRALAEIANIFSKEFIVHFGLGLALSPSDLLHRLFSHHTDTHSHFSNVINFPKGVAAEIFNKHLLINLKDILINRYPRTPHIAVQSVIQEGMPISCQSFDALASYNIDPTLLPLSIELTTNSGVEILNKVIDSGNALDCQFGYFNAWKQVVINTNQNKQKNLIINDVKNEFQSGAETRLRVLYVSSPSATSGGEESLRYLITALDKSSLEPLALISLSGTFGDHLRKAGATVIVPNHDFSSVTVENILYSLQLLKEINPDIIHFNSLYDLPIMIASKLLGLPSVQHVRVAEKAAFGEQLYNSDVIVAISNFVKTEILKSYVHPERVRVIYNEVDRYLFRPELFSKSEARCKLGISADSKVIIKVARLMPSKRHDLLLAAFSKVLLVIPDAKLLLLGEAYGASEYIDYLQDEIDRLDLRDNITFLPFQDDVRQVLSSSDALVLCSDREPLGRCVIEAMAMRIPVVVTGSGGTPEVVQNRNTGIVVQGNDPSELASALITVLTDSSLVSQITQKAEQFVDKFLDSKNSAQKFQAIYQELAQNLRSTPAL